MTKAEKAAADYLDRRAAAMENDGKETGENILVRASQLRIEAKNIRDGFMRK